TVSPEDLEDLFGEASPFSDFYETLFGGTARGGPRGRAAPRPRRGRDVEQPIQVTLEEAFRGTQRVLSFQTPEGQTRRLALTIPPGTQDGRVFRLRGQGMPRLGQAERPGDLHAEVHAHLPERLSARQRELIEEFTHLGAGAAEGAAAR